MTILGELFGYDSTGHDLLGERADLFYEIEKRSGGTVSPTWVELCCYFAVSAIGIALLIVWLMPLPKP